MPTVKLHNLPVQIGSKALILSMLDILYPEINWLSWSDPEAAPTPRQLRLYATHVRNRDIYYDHGFGEAITTARAAGARLQISHIQPKFGAPPHAMEHTLELIEAARRRDLDVAFDVIPHDWAHTLVSSILPKWALEGGPSALLERLVDPDGAVMQVRGPLLDA